MADDFDDFDAEFNGDLDEGGRGRSGRPFLLAAGSLVGLLLLSLLCYAAFNMFSGDDVENTAIAVDQSTAATATSISATNEAVATSNSFVTQTIESMEMTASAPTNTPTPLPPTNTPQPTPSQTPSPTPTVEVEESEEGEVPGEEGEDETGGSTPNAAATGIFGGLNTATPSSGGGTGGTGGSGTGGTGTGGTGTGGTGGGTLPETGISLWEGLLAAVGLLVLVVAARRLRK